MSPQALEGRQAPITLIKTVEKTKEEGGGGGGKLPGAKKLPRKCWLGLCSKNIVYSVSMWTPGACTQIDTAGHLCNTYM